MTRRRLFALLAALGLKPKPKSQAQPTLPGRHYHMLLEDDISIGPINTAQQVKTLQWHQTISPALDQQFIAAHPITWEDDIPPEAFQEAHE